MDAHKRLLLGNKAWVQERLDLRPDYFTSLAVDQTPTYLWIGCSDSRVPAEDVTGTEPGELFVHRNIANVVVHTDFNLLSVLHYGVEVLKVKHVIVCGHYGCGGIKNAMTTKRFGLIDHWLRHIKDVQRLYAAELDAIKDEELRFKKMVEYNVIEQVRNISNTTIIERSWAQQKSPIIHGWVYDLKTGLLKELLDVTPE